MSCEFFKELIFKKLDNEINDDEEKVLLEHLQSCRECQTDFKQLGEIEDILDNQQMVEVPQSFSKAVVDKIKQPVKKRVFIRPVFTVAAACVILVLAFYSHAFDSLLSAGNIVQKQNTNNSSNSLQDDISKKRQDSEKEQMSSYIYSGAGDKKANDDVSQSKSIDNKDVYRSETDVQKNQPLQQNENEVPTKTQQPEQEDTMIAEGVNQADLKEDGSMQEFDDSQMDPQASAKMFGTSSTAAAGDESTYKAVATVMEEKQKIVDILKKYTITQKSELEFELLKDEFDKLNVEFKSKNIQVEVKDININSDVVLLVITNK